MGVSLRCGSSGGEPEQGWSSQGFQIKVSGQAFVSLHQLVIGPQEVSEGGSCGLSAGKAQQLGRDLDSKEGIWVKTALVATLCQHWDPQGTHSLTVDFST